MSAPTSSSESIDGLCRYRHRRSDRADAAHNVRFHDTGIKEFHHPVVGELTLTYNRMELSADPGLAITIYTAEPGTTSAEALSLLGSRAATSDQAEPAQQT
jgi:hypothetical protein